MSDRIKSVAVVGRDASLWLAAAALQRALGRTGLRVHAVDLGSHLTEVDVYAAVPTLGLLHRLLGVDDSLVLKICRGVPMVGQRFSNWAKGAPPFLLAYDDAPQPGGDLPFVQYWAKGMIEGLRVGLEDFSLGSACARLNAVPVPGDEPQPFSASYGYHLHAAAYAELIKQLAIRSGVEAAPVGVANIDTAGNRVEGIDLADGTRLSADLYVDASGPEATLLAGLASARFASWSQWLPCDRLLTAVAPRLSALPAFSQMSAMNAGWVGLYPIQDRTTIATVYNSSAIGDADIVELTSVMARLPIAGDVIVSDLKPGAQCSPWIGNCVAIGEAAISVDPIDSVGLQVTHGCISHLISLFPATAGEFPEADAYNAVIGSFSANLRDFQAAHYVFNKRFDEPMWDAVRDAALPGGLARKAELFAARAAIPVNDDETFDEQSWAALLTGCGVVPQGYDARVDSLPGPAHVAKVQQRLRDVAALARKMPSVEQFLGIQQSAPAEARG